MTPAHTQIRPPTLHPYTFRTTKKYNVLNVCVRACMSLCVCAFMLNAFNFDNMYL